MHDEQHFIIFLVCIMISCPLHLTRIFCKFLYKFCVILEAKDISFGHTTYHYSCHWEWVEKLGDFHWKMPCLCADARNSKKCAQLWMHICRYTNILIFFYLWRYLSDDISIKNMKMWFWPVSKNTIKHSKGGATTMTKNLCQSLSRIRDRQPLHHRIRDRQPLHHHERGSIILNSFTKFPSTHYIES